MAPALLSTALTMKTETSERGFTLIEIIVVMAILMIVAVFTYPNILAIANRNRIEGSAQHIRTLMHSSRLQAIKQKCYGVVMIDPAARKVIAFLDRDRNGELDSEDTQLGVVDLPFQVHFRDEAGAEGLASVEEFDNPDPLPEKRAIFKEDGTLASTGALRVADDRGNAMEVFAENASLVPVIRKHEGGSVYIPKGDASSAWKFK